MNKKIEILIKSSFEKTINETFQKNNESKKHFNNKDNVLKPDEINFSTEFSKIFEENSKENGTYFHSISEFKYQFLKEIEIDQSKELEEDKKINKYTKHFDKNKKMFFDSFSFNGDDSIIFEFKKNSSGFIKKDSIIDLMRIIYLMKFEKIKFGVVGAFPNDLNKNNIDKKFENIKPNFKDLKNFEEIANYSYSTINNSKKNNWLVLINNFNQTSDSSSKDNIWKQILRNYFILDEINNLAEDIINNKKFWDLIEKTNLSLFIEEFYPKRNKNYSYKDLLGSKVINSIISKIKVEDLVSIFIDINTKKTNLFKKEFFDQAIFDDFSIPEIFQNQFKYNDNENEIFSKVLTKIKKNSKHINDTFKINLKIKKEDEKIDNTINFMNDRTFIIISSWNKILNNKIEMKCKKNKKIELEKTLYKNFSSEKDRNNKIFEFGFKTIIIIGLYAYYLSQTDSNYTKNKEETKSNNKKINELIKELNKINNKINNKKNISKIDISKFDDMETFSEEIIEIIFSKNKTKKK